MKTSDENIVELLAMKAKGIYRRDCLGPGVGPGPLPEHIVQEAENLLRKELDLLNVDVTITEEHRNAVLKEIHQLK